MEPSRQTVRCYPVAAARGSFAALSRLTVNHDIIAILLLAILAPAEAQHPSIATAAARYVPGITWRTTSVVTGDFSCSGRREQAILGTSRSDIVVAVFLNGTTERPEVLHYSTGMRDPSTASLMIESSDYDANKEIGSPLPGFRRSKTCKGLNLSDGKVDAAHIYWNHDSRRFADWVR
jgi:hypothetical protein